ncbi:hypothetical protein [Paraburkholderia fungorum]|jgi:hypothetical protein|uniref:hypothetical protein n=1 Tax=Paraburkholderia fungorum TaxID=134537 RepID=UPI000D06BEC8|nr:hypothetical protein [Paraburkholderia fungorum]PRZ45346.1 hypothetical protein BX589_13925 [Paraburkholderia fungorum]
MAIYISRTTPLSVFGNTLDVRHHSESLLQLIEHIKHGSILVSFYTSPPKKNSKPVTSFKANDEVWISLSRPGTKEEARSIGKRYKNTFIGTALLKKAQNGTPFVFDKELRSFLFDNLCASSGFHWTENTLCASKAITVDMLFDRFYGIKNRLLKNLLSTLPRGKRSIEKYIANQIDFGDAIFIRILPTYERDQIHRIARMSNKYNYQWVSLLPDEALDDDELFRKLIRINPRMLGYATQRVKSIRDIALYALDCANEKTGLDWRPSDIASIHTAEISSMVYATSKHEFINKLDILKRRWSIHDKLMQDLAVDHEEDDQPTFTKI